MKHLILTLTLIGIMTNTYSQSTLLWSKNFSTEPNNYFTEHPRIQTVADTINVIGRKNTNDGERLLIVKYDLFGDTISTKILGNDSVFNNKIIDYKFDTLNHVYILNKERLGFFKSKIVLQKYSLEGNLIWVEQVQDPADTSYAPRSLGLVNDTCLFFTVYKEYDYPESDDDVVITTKLSQLYAFNSNGNQLWYREFNPNTEISRFAYDIFVHDNTAFLFAYNTASINRLVTVDINNNLTINSNTGMPNGINGIQLTPDNNLLVIAVFGRYRISKVSLTGSLIWTQDYESNLPSNVTADEMVAITQDSAGNIYTTGRHYGLNYGTSGHTSADILTLKYNSNGNLIWQNRYEYGVNNADIGNTIVLKNGQIYVGGESQRLGVETDYDYLVLKIDSATGESTGVYRYNGLANGHDRVSSLYVFDNGNVALTGLSYNINSKYDWTTQLLSDIVLSVQNMDKENSFHFYPNPTTSGDVLTIAGNGIKSYSIISATGQIVQQGRLETNEYNSIYINNVSTGMYLLYLKTDNGILTQKLIVK